MSLTVNNEQEEAVIKHFSHVRSLSRCHYVRVFAFSPLMPREETHPRAHSAQGGGVHCPGPRCSALLLAAARNGTSLKPDAALFPPLTQHSSLIKTEREACVSVSQR